MKKSKTQKAIPNLAPKISYTLPPLLLKQGESASIPVKISAYPSPYVEWYVCQQLIIDCRDFQVSTGPGRLGKPDEWVTVLEIKRVDQALEGNVVLRVSNAYGKDEFCIPLKTYKLLGGVPITDCFIKPSQGKISRPILLPPENKKIEFSDLTNKLNERKFDLRDQHETVEEKLKNQFNDKIPVNITSGYRHSPEIKIYRAYEEEPTDETDKSKINKRLVDSLGSKGSENEEASSRDIGDLDYRSPPFYSIADDVDDDWKIEMEKRNAMRSIDDIIDNLKELDEEENDEVSCDDDETKAQNVVLMKDNINKDNEAGSININNKNNIENINENSVNCIDDTKIKYIPKIKKKNYKWGAFNKNINLLPSGNVNTDTQWEQKKVKNTEINETKNDETGTFNTNFGKYALPNKLAEDSTTCSKDNGHLSFDKKILEKKDNDEEEDDDDGREGLWCMDGKRLSNLCGRLLGGFSHQHYKMHMHLLSQQQDYLPFFDQTRYHEIKQNIGQGNTKDKFYNTHSFKFQNEQQPPQTQQPKNFTYQEEEQFYFQQKLEMQQQQKNQEKQKPFFTKNQKQLQNTSLSFAKPYLVSQKTHTILNKTSAKTAPTTIQPMAINATIINILKPTTTNTIPSDLSKLISAPSTIAIKTTMNIASTSNVFSTFTTPTNFATFYPTVTTSVCRFGINTHSNFNGALECNPPMTSSIRSILYTSNESIFTQTTSYSPSTKLMLPKTQSTKILDPSYSSLASTTSSSLSSLLSSLSSSSSSEANILLYSKKLDRLTQKLDNDLSKEFDERLKLIDNSQEEVVSFVDKETFLRDKLVNYVNFNVVLADHQKSCTNNTSNNESLKKCGDLTNENEKKVKCDNLDNLILAFNQSNENKCLTTKLSSSSNSSPSSSVITVVKNPLKPALPPKPVFSKQQKESMHLRTSRPKSSITSSSNSNGSSGVVSQVNSSASKPIQFPEAFDCSSSCPPSVITRRKNLKMNSDSEELLNNVDKKLKTYGSFKGDYFKQKFFNSFNSKNVDKEIKYNYNFLGKNVSDNEFDDISNKNIFCSLEKLPLKKGLSSRSLSNHRRSFCKKVQVVTTTTRTEEEVLTGSSNKSNYIKENIDFKKDIRFDDKNSTKISEGLYSKAVGYQVNGERKFFYEPKENSADILKQKIENENKLNKFENLFLNNSMNKFKEKARKTKKTEFNVEDKVFERDLQELKNNQHYLVYYDSNNKVRQEQAKQSCDLKPTLKDVNLDLFRSNLSNICVECPEKEELNSAQKLFNLLNESRLYREGSTDE